MGKQTSDAAPCIVPALVAILTVVAVAGCAGNGRDAGFSSVQRAVSNRSGYLVQWRGHSADDASVDAAVGSLLAHPLNANDAVQVALLNNLNLQATYEELGIAQADLVQAGLLKNPGLHLERRFPGQAAEIDVVEDFLDVFLIPLRRKLAAAQFDQAKFRVAQEALNLAQDVSKAFYTLQAQQQSIEMRRQVAESTAAAADVAQRLYDAGNSSLLDLRTQQRLASQARLDLDDAIAQAAIDRERLNTLMGLWPNEDRWSIAARLPVLPESDVALSGLQSIALVQRLDLATAREQVRIDARSLGIADATRVLPQLDVSAHYEHEISPRHSLGPSIDLTLPIFDQGQAASARGNAILAQSQLRYVALGTEICSQVRSAYSKMAAAAKRARYYQNEVLPLQQQILDQTQRHYNGMYVGVFQLLLAKQAQIEAARQYIDSLRDYWIARAELQHAIGGQIPPPRRSTTSAPSRPAAGE